LAEAVLTIVLIQKNTSSYGHMISETLVAFFVELEPLRYDTIKEFNVDLKAEYSA